jgi:hypothetical protein
MKKNVIQLSFLLVTLMVYLGACKKERDLSTANTASQTNKAEPLKKLQVSTIEELYTAVNDPENTGTQVILAPGIYVLSATYPNGGRLELQQDMSLLGQPGQRDAVIIDQSALPASSFTIPAGRTGGIRTGRGINAIEWLSLKGGAVSANPFSVLNTDLLSTETELILSHVYVDVNGSNLGINLRNRLAEHANRKVYATLEDNEMTGAINVNGIALALQNANGSSGALIDVTMRNNYIHGNKIGILCFSTTGAVSISSCTILINSSGDRLEGNGVGLDVSAGVNQSGVTTSNNHVTTIAMHGTSIRDNNPPGMPQLVPVNGALPGGIYAATAYNSVNNITGYNRASDNKMTISLWGCDISNNNGTDIYAYGAWCPPAAVLGGSNNLLELYLYGLSSNATVIAVASSPVEPAGTNVVNVYRN